jgi:hypothetical protein
MGEIETSWTTQLHSYECIQQLALCLFLRRDAACRLRALQERESKEMSDFPSYSAHKSYNGSGSGKSGSGSGSGRSGSGSGKQCSKEELYDIEL